MLGIIGDLFGAIGDLMEMFSYPYAILMLVLSALFIWWLLAKFWWKETPQAPADPEADAAINPEEAPSVENADPDELSETPETPETKASKKKGRSK